MLKKLRRKFVLINMICVGILLLGVFFALTGMTYRVEREVIYRGLQHVNGIITKGEHFPQPDDGSENLKFRCETVILDANRKTVNSYENLKLTDSSSVTSAAVNEIMNAEKSSGELYLYGYIYYKHALDDGGYAITVTDAYSLFSRIEITAWISGLVLLCCFLVFFALSYILARIAMKPAEKTWEGQKQFVADASHDLKTPLTVILANTEIIKSHSDESVSNVTKWLDSTKEESERMRRLVNNMLELAKNDDLSETLKLTDTGISDICELTALQMEPIAFEKGVTLNTDISQGIVIKSDADALSRLVHILIENGIKYAPSGTEVTVSLRREWRDVRLSVKNSGSYINKDDLPFIFERFYRSDKTRGSSGFGLGLSIAKGLCDKMGATIQCDSRENFGTEFTVNFNIDLSMLIPNIRIRKKNL